MNLKSATILLLGLLWAGLGSNARADSDFRRPGQLPESIINPYQLEKVQLGRALFFDVRLSGNNSQSCASCHKPEYGWSDGQAKSRGAEGQLRDRHTPSLYDLAWAQTFAWDGRVESLEGFILGPVTHPGEMNQNPEALIEELSEDADIRDMFKVAFGRETVTLDGISLSIASFIRTLRSGLTPFDRWLAGDEAAIEPSAKHGFELFKGKAGCVSCHDGWRFTDDGFHDTGLAGEDHGRQSVQKDAVPYSFKTPALRNLRYSAPYMHDGSLPDLRAVIDHYSDPALNRLDRDPSLKKVQLSETEKLNLISFLETLSEE